MAATDWDRSDSIQNAKTQSTSDGLMNEKYLEGPVI